MDSETRLAVLRQGAAEIAGLDERAVPGKPPLGRPVAIMRLRRDDGCGGRVPGFALPGQRIEGVGGSDGGGSGVVVGSELPCI